jgi:hypothetical protein
MTVVLYDGKPEERKALREEYLVRTQRSFASGGQLVGSVRAHWGSHSDERCSLVLWRGRIQQTTGNFNVVLTHYDLILKDKAPLGKVIGLKTLN